MVCTLGEFWSIEGVFLGDVTGKDEGVLLKDRARGELVG
jgi:hypothetical protein